jgi:hypothetical protein
VARRAGIAPRAAIPWPAARRAAPHLLAPAFLAGLALATLALWSRSDLDLFRWPMAELALHGHPLLVYTVHSGIWRSDNGPLSLLPLTAVVAAVNAVGWQTDAPLRDAVVVGLFGLFALAFAREAVRSVGSAVGRPLSRSVATWSAFLLAPPLWIGMVSYGHVELPLELWLVLLAVRQLGRDRTAVAGCLLGLALLTQTAALLAALPLVLLLAAGRRLGAAAVLLGTAAIVATAGLLPFLLADCRDVIASLVTYRGQVPALGGSLWTLFAHTPVAGFVRHDDALVFGGAAVALTWLGARRGGGTVADTPRVFALMAVSTACLPLLAKTVWPYYLVAPCAFATIWWLARPGRVDNWRLYVPVLFSAAAVARLASAPAICVGLPVACGMALLLADPLGVSFHEVREEAAGPGSGLSQDQGDVEGGGDSGGMGLGDPPSPGGSTVPFAGGRRRGPSSATRTGARRRIAKAMTTSAGPVSGGPAAPDAAGLTAAEGVERAGVLTGGAGLAATDGVGLAATDGGALTDMLAAMATTETTSSR